MRKCKFLSTAHIPATTKLRQSPSAGELLCSIAAPSQRLGRPTGPLLLPQTPWHLPENKLSASRGLKRRGPCSRRRTAATEGCESPSNCRRGSSKRSCKRTGTPCSTKKSTGRHSTRAKTRARSCGLGTEESFPSRREIAQQRLRLSESFGTRSSPRAACWGSGSAAAAAAAAEAAAAGYNRRTTRGGDVREENVIFVKIWRILFSLVLYEDFV